MTKTEVAELLRTTEGAAVGWLSRNGVQAIPLGPGRGLGNRWYKHEILQALNETRKPNKKKIKPKIRSGSMFIGGMDEIIAGLTGSRIKH